MVFENDVVDDVHVPSLLSVYPLLHLVHFVPEESHVLQFETAQVGEASTVS